jgi:glycosyltransferase involved in cell wall biosynthesis
VNVVCVNYTFDRPITDPDVLLDRYDTLVGWAEGLTSAGAKVTVIQRFGVNAERMRNGTAYQFVHDPSLKDGSLADRATRVNAAAAAALPDIVHVNGLQFARQAWRLKGLIKRQGEPGGVPLLVQDHANAPPQNAFYRWALGRALRRMDAVSFVSRDQAQPWFDAGLLQPAQHLVELMEGSSRFALQPRDAARAKTGLTGDPLCLWVGRLDANKDPLTVLRGFAAALPAMPNAQLAMVFSSVKLLPEIRKWLQENLKVSESIALLGRRPHVELEDIYNSADLFVLGSHREGSGYAVLEALACGVVPVVTRIPSFRVLTSDGAIGDLWPAGDVESVTRSLIRQYSRLHPDSPQEVRAFFDARFRWDQIGRSAMEVYRGMLRTQSDCGG